MQNRKHAEPVLKLTSRISLISVYQNVLILIQNLKISAFSKTKIIVSVEIRSNSILMLGEWITSLIGWLETHFFFFFKKRRNNASVLLVHSDNNSNFWYVWSERLWCKEKLYLIHVEIKVFSAEIHSSVVLKELDCVLVWDVEI